MKIAHIGHKRIPGGEGGVEVVVEELTVRMAALGHDVTVYNRAKAGQPKQRTYKGVRTITVPTIDSKRLDALIYSFFATFHALFGRYDILHYHSLGPNAMIFLPRLFGLRVVSTVHGLDWQRAKWSGFAKKYLMFGEKMIAKKANAVVVLSEGNQQYFAETYQRATTLIPNGISAAQPLPADVIEKEFGLSKDSYFLFLARIVPEKGLHYLIDAYQKLDTDKKLVIAGDASHSSDYMQSIRQQVAGDPRIVMTGFIAGQAKAELFSNCYMYILPSDIEGMPLSLLEAKSYGARCLVSDIEENLLAMKGQGRSFLHGNTEDLQAVLEECLAAPPPPSTLEGHADWDEVTQQTLALYQRCGQGVQ